MIEVNKMRTIDADTLKRRAQKVATEAWKMKIKAEVETVLNQFIDWIDEAPTIQTESHWISCEKKDTEKNIDTYIQALDRAKTLLKATWNLLQKQNETIYVLNMLEELVYYDEAECDGSCLMDDINYWFDEFCDEELDNKYIKLKEKM